MKVVGARVVKGAIKTRARLPEGARWTVIQHDDRSAIRLDSDEEAGVLEGIREIEAGKGIPVAKVRAKLRRHR